MIALQNELVFFLIALMFLLDKYAGLLLTPSNFFGTYLETD